MSTPASEQGIGTTAGPLLCVRGLRVELTDGRRIVDNVSFEITEGEILCLIGESGSGKTTVSTALLAHVRPGAHIVAGQVIVDGVDVLQANEARLRALRGRSIAYIAQDPTAAFNPAMRIGTHMIEVACAHGLKDGQALALAALAEVGLPATDAFMARFPHQLSGGQLQRVGIAIALLLKPRLVIFDEPTTGLDVATQARFLSLVRRLCTQRRIGVLYITHDLAVVARIADRTIVMLKGQVVEQGQARDMFLTPSHAYSTSLLAAAPDIEPLEGWTPPSEISTRCLLEVSGLTSSYAGHRILEGISLQVRSGECLAIVGQSGSGKSTLSKGIIGLHPIDSGAIRFNGEALSARTRDRSAEARRGMQYIFQSPYSAFNPRRTIGASIALAYKVVMGGTSAESQRAVVEALEKVSLSPDKANQYPHALSGGERQRAAIARALVCRPHLLICDEITSALDVVVQQAVLDLLDDLRRSQNLALLFVTHNIAVVRRIADRVLVLDQGRIAEIGSCEDILDRPRHPFTQTLVSETISIRRTVQERWSTGSATISTSL